MGDSQRIGVDILDDREVIRMLRGPKAGRGGPEGETGDGLDAFSLKADGRCADQPLPFPVHQ